MQMDDGYKQGLKIEQLEDKIKKKEEEYSQHLGELQI